MADRAPLLIPFFVEGPLDRVSLLPVLERHINSEFLAILEVVPPFHELILYFIPIDVEPFEMIREGGF